MSHYEIARTRPRHQTRRDVAEQVRFAKYNADKHNR